MPFVLGPTSLKRLAGVHPNLVMVVHRALELSAVDFAVLEGVRTLTRQRELYAKGRTARGPKVTWTMKSKHLTGHAVDLVPWPVDWEGPARYPKFDAISRAMFAAASDLGVVIRWGADWDGDGNSRERGENDSPHWELTA